MSSLIERSRSWRLPSSAMSWSNGKGRLKRGLEGLPEHDRVDRRQPEIGEEPRLGLDRHDRVDAQDFAKDEPQIGKNLGFAG